MPGGESIMTPATREALLEVAALLKRRYEECRSTTEELRGELAAVYSRLGFAVPPPPPDPIRRLTPTENAPEIRVEPPTVRRLVGEFMADRLRFTPAELRRAVHERKPDANPGTINAELNKRYMDDREAVREADGSYISLL